MHINIDVISQVAYPCDDEAVDNIVGQSEAFHLRRLAETAAAIICRSIGSGVHTLGSHFICPSPPHLEILLIFYSIS